MNAAIGVSSLTAAYLAEPILPLAGDMTLAAVAVAGSVVALRHAARLFGTARQPDTFDAYREARRSAQGLAVG